VRDVTSRIRIVCGALALGIVLAGTPFAAASLPHLHGIEEIRDWFNAGRGHVRLILLLSPT
jgi:hypothetical protein